MRSVSVGMPKPGNVVKWLLIVNGAAFALQLILLFSVGRVGGVDPLSKALGATVGDFWQVWRYVTFQFLHSPSSLFHIGLNMLGLYMLGTPLEQTWGSRRFLRFYLTCGAAAGVLYVIVGAILGNYEWVPLIGASGGVYGVLLACAVLFPHMRLIFFLFPVPIRLAVLIIFAAMIFNSAQALFGPGRDMIIYNGEFWSGVAHFGGALMGAMWLWVIPKLSPMTQGAVRRAKKGAWERKMRQARQEQAEIDRILDKIRTQGLASLSRKEQRALKEATRKQQREDRDISRL